MTNQENRLRWENARVLRETKLSAVETLSLVEDADSGARAWILRGAPNAAASSMHHPSVLPMTESFSDERGLALVFPSLEAATIRQTLDSFGEGAVSAAPLGERLLSALRANLFELSVGADLRTWSQQSGKLVADLCLQIVRIAMHLQEQGRASLTAERLLLTPFGRVLFWDVPSAPSAESLPLHGAGSVVAALIGLEARDAQDSLSAIGYCAHPNYSQDRYDSLTNLAADLERYLADMPVHAHRPGKLLLGARRLISRPRRAAAAFFLLAGAAAATIWGLASFSERPDSNVPPAKIAPAKPAPEAPQESKPAPKPETTNATAPSGPTRASRGPSAPSWERIPGASLPSPR